MPSPSTKEELQTLLRILNFLTRYIPNLITRNRSLSNLLRNEIFAWEQNHETSLKEIEQTIASNLAHFIKNQWYNPVGIQRFQKYLRVCFEVSKEIRAKLFATREKLFTILFGVKHFHQYNLFQYVLFQRGIRLWLNVKKSQSSDWSKFSDECFDPFTVRITAQSDDPDSDSQRF